METSSTDNQAVAPLRLSLVQTDIAWEAKKENLDRLAEKLCALRGATDVAVLPEMFSTGFSMRSRELAESVTGFTMQVLKRLAAEFQMALCGSFIGSEGTCYYNRGFFVTPEGEEYYRDKRHLFRMGHETQYFSAGTDRAVFAYRGWNIRLLVCYDLRFPVWSRNVDNECDLLIYVANWPRARRAVWDVLLRARALENMCYVCGVNRIGHDGNGIYYDGGSKLFSAKGEMLASVPDGDEGVATASISLAALGQLRSRFPAWMDADDFSL